MDKLSLKDLRIIAKQRGYVRYSTLNKYGLINLLMKGHHKLPDKFTWVYPDKGVSPSIFASPSTNFKLMGLTKFRYTIRTEMYNATSRIIRGIDLTGMFNAKFIPDTCRIIRGIDLTGMFNAKFIPDTSEDDYVFIEGGWIVSESDYPNFCAFYDSLLTSANQPKSLFEIAAWVVSSRKQEQYIPKTIQKRINQIARIR